ncbi:MAG TPA: hypothetical protein VFZ08_03415 [Terriglobia bacterium]|nr:hypothetical protein [Terriglobia bacterium]
MARKIAVLAVVSFFFVSIRGQADFRYTQTSQITGGAMAGVVHALGMFSKKLREPMPSTTYVKGDYLRTDEADGSYQIIDLSGQRIIHVNPKKSSYSVATFEQMREALQKASERINQQTHSGKDGETNVKMTPKIEVNPTGRTQTLLGQSAQEVNMKVELEMEATDQTHGTQKGSLDTVVDSWIASSVNGYGEVSAFYKKMASEIGWTPGSFGPDPRVAKSMADLYRGGKIPQGMPLLQVINLTGTGQTPPQQQGTPQQQQAAPQQQPAQSSSPSVADAVPQVAAAKAIGGMFGGFGRFGHKKKKKQQQDEEQQSNSNASSSANSANNNTSGNSAPSNSLMEMTIRVTSYSTDSVDASLFQIPAGFTQVQLDTEKMLHGNR